MNTDLISTSLQLDTLLQEKFKALFTITECKNASFSELKTQLNSLKYLIYILNQDRLVIITQSLRQALLQKSQGIQFPANSEKDSLKSSGSNYHQYDFYEVSGSSSEFCTVINTSILPTSHEQTEREFSPFAISPLYSPRLQNENPANTVLFTTEATCNKKKRSEMHSPEILKSDDYIISESDSSEIDLSFFTMNSGSYVHKHFGDDDCSPMWSVACETSERNSPYIKD